MKLTVNVELDRQAVHALLERVAEDIYNMSNSSRTYAKFLNHEIDTDEIQRKLAEYNYYLSKIIDLDNARKQLEGMSQEDILGETSEGMDSSPTE